MQAFAGGWCPTNFSYTLGNQIVVLSWGNCDTSHKYYLEIRDKNGFRSEAILLNSANPRSFSFSAPKGHGKIKVNLLLKRTKAPLSECRTEVLNIAY